MWLTIFLERFQFNNSMFRGFVSWAIICQDEQTPHFEAGLRKFLSWTSFEERPGATCQSHEPTKGSTLATLFSLFNFSFSSCRSLRTLHVCLPTKWIWSLKRILSSQLLCTFVFARRRAYSILQFQRIITHSSLNQTQSSTNWVHSLYFIHFSYSNVFGRNVEKIVGDRVVRVQISWIQIERVPMERVEIKQFHIGVWRL